MRHFYCKARQVRSFHSWRDLRPWLYIPVHACACLPVVAWALACAGIRLHSSPKSKVTRTPPQARRRRPIGLILPYLTCPLITGGFWRVAGELLANSALSPFHSSFGLCSSCSSLVCFYLSLFFSYMLIVATFVYFLFLLFFSRFLFFCLLVYISLYV